jgi:Beta propeller domain
LIDVKETAMFSNLTWCLALCSAVALSGCGGGGKAADDAGTNTGLAASRPGELTQYLQNKVREREAQRAAGVTQFYGAAAATDVSIAADTTAAPPAAAPTRSGSLLQEAGVDELDLLQSDGQFIYTLQPQGNAQRLRAYSRSADGSPVLLKALDLPAEGTGGATLEGMVLSDDHKSLAVLSQRWQGLPAIDPICAELCLPAPVPGGLPFAPTWVRNLVQVQRVDVSNPAAAALGERVSIDGRLIDSRRVGDWLLVVTSHVPRLPLDQVASTATAAEREALIAKLSASKLLPSMQRNDAAATPLVAETDCWLQPGNGSLSIEFTTLTVFDLRSPSLAHSSRCFVGGTEALYMTVNNLYLATTRWAIPAASAGVLRYPDQITTSIHKFKFNAGNFSYRASGEVPGHLGWNPQYKSYRMSEALVASSPSPTASKTEQLRVLSFTGSSGWANEGDTSGPPSPASLTVLAEGASSNSGPPALQVLASLPNAKRPALLGKPGEQLQGVRFAGDRAYLVTFRRTDPLYVLDLSSDTDPKVAGQLEVPGFSDQLFPLANGLLLGVGKDADANGRVSGIKLALFDVADAAQPRLASSVVLGDAGSLTALDLSRHGLNMWDKNGTQRIALPANLINNRLGAPVPGTSGLLRFEVDTAARSLRQLPTVGSAALTGMQPLWLERSLQIGDTVYYANATGLQSYGW